MCPSGSKRVKPLIVSKHRQNRKNKQKQNKTKRKKKKKQLEKKVQDIYI